MNCGKHIFLLYITIPFIVCQGELKLVYTHVIYRHGDRSPSGTFPKDKYQADFWPQGWNQLTNKGMEQQYGLGQYFRERYVKRFRLLSESYQRSEIYVRSTDTDRTLQSAQCNLAGLYPANGSQIWHPSDLKMWQPIPIHTVPIQEDILLDMDAYCPNYLKFIEKSNAERIQKYNEEYKDFFIYVGEKTGWTSLSIKTIQDVYSSLFREKEQNLTVSEWVDEIYDRKNNLTVFDIILQLKTVDKNMAYDSGEKSKYCAGYLIGDIMERMKEISNNVKKGELQKSTKMMMYSAHSDTVLALMHVMRTVKEELIVPYLGCLMIELYKSDLGQYTVQVYYRNSTNGDPIDLTETICGSVSCPFKKFSSVLSSQILYPMEKRNEFCGLNIKKRDESVKNAGLGSNVVESKILNLFILLNSICIIQ